jgi:prepilin peptidase CpaA
MIFALLLIVSLTAAVLDWRSRRIPSWLTLSGIALGIALNLFERGIIPGLLFSVAGMALALAVYLPLYALRATGGGDGMLMTAIGAAVGWKDWILVFAISAVLGGVVALAIAAANRRLRRTLWNVGFALTEMKQGRPAYVRHEEMDVRSAKALTFPRGVVIAAAVLLYLTIQYVRK